MGLADLLDRSPTALSGGERQRVALGRALLAQPRLLLMDEPLAGLDQVAKEEILPYIETLQRDAVRAGSLCQPRSARGRPVGRLDDRAVGWAQGLRTALSKRF